jgi:hypothetical protein
MRPTSKAQAEDAIYAEKHFSHKYAQLSDSDSDATLTEEQTTPTRAETLSERQTRLARQNIVKFDIDNLKSSRKSNPKSRADEKMPKPKSHKSTTTASSFSSSSSSKASAEKPKKSKIGRFFDMSSLATPIAIYNLPADFHGDDPNVYWDEDAQVWRYWYYTWCPIF